MSIIAVSCSGTSARSKEYHSDHPYHVCQNVGVMNPEASNAPKDIQVSPVTPHDTSAFHPSGSHHPKDVYFDNQFRFKV